MSSLHRELQNGSNSTTQPETKSLPTESPSENARLTFEAEDTIGAGEFLLLEGNFGLNDSGDAIILKNGDEETVSRDGQSMN